MDRGVTAGVGIGRALLHTISLLFFLALATAGWAQVTISGTQTRGSGTSGILESTPVNLPQGGAIRQVNNQGDCFWLEGPTGTKQFERDTAAVGYVLAPGLWKAFPCLRAGQNRASVSVVVGGSPAPKSAQPVFGRLDAGGMPSCLNELSPNVWTAAHILNAGTSYTIWAAPKRPGQPYTAAAWKPFGPWTLAGRQRSVFRWEGGNGRLVNDPAMSATTLSPALAFLTWQNDTPESVWLIVNPLPPGCSQPAGGLAVSISPAQQTVDSGGSITLTASVAGGTPPYRYQWFNGNNQSPVTKESVTWTNLRNPGPRTFRLSLLSSPPQGRPA